MNKLSIVINTANRKTMLFELIDSIYKSDYQDTFEIIVVDDFSKEDYSEEIRQRYPRIKFIRNDRRKFLIVSRNIGWRASSGEYVFFIDDDNEIFDAAFFSKMQERLSALTNVGILGIRTYYFSNPDIVLVGVTQFNKYIGKTKFWGTNKPDFNQDDDKILQTHDNPNAFVIKRSYLEEVNGFSEEIVQTFSEADMAEKIRRLGLQVVQCPLLKVYHKSPVTNYKKMNKRHMGGSPERFYFLMRNRFVFIKKFGTFAEKTLFALFFSHIYSIYYLGLLIWAGEFQMVKAGCLGLLHGYIFIFGGKLRNRYA